MSEEFIKRKLLRENDALQKVLKRLLDGVKETNDKKFKNETKKNF